MSIFFDTLRAYPNLLATTGVVGSFIYIGGFALVQFGRACGNGPLYSASKIVAAILVMISLVGAFNLGAFLIQAGFITFGLVGLGRQLAIKPQTLPPKNKLPQDATGRATGDDAVLFAAASSDCDGSCSTAPPELKLVH